MFSVDVYEFKSFPTALMGALKYWVTELPDEAMRESSARVGWIFYVFWTILFVMILGNVFVAIVIDAYTMEKEYTEEEELLQGPAELDKVFTKGIWQLTDRIRSILQLEQTGTAEALVQAGDRNNDGTLDQEEIMDTFQVTQNESASIIEMLDMDADGKLSPEELAALQDTAEMKVQGSLSPTEERKDPERKDLELPVPQTRPRSESNS